MRIVLLIVSLLLIMPITDSWWAEGSHILLDVDEVCRKAKRSRRGKLTEICRDDQLFLEVKRGINLGFMECESQFKNRKWNCTKVRRNMKKILMKDTRETGFLNAITSAGVTFAVTRACAMGNLVDCSCDKKSTVRRTYFMEAEVAAEAAIAAGFQPPPLSVSSSSGPVAGTSTNTGTQQHPYHRSVNGIVNGNVYHDTGTATHGTSGGGGGSSASNVMDFPYGVGHPPNYNNNNHHGVVHQHNTGGYYGSGSGNGGLGGNGNKNRRAMKKLMQNNDNGQQLNGGARVERKKKRGNSMRRNTLQNQIEEPERDWKWGGCDDNVNFGYRKSKQFFDARYRNRSDIKTVLRLHNTEAGRLAVKWNMRLECKCHGLSGSCTTKTCWMRMPSFQEVGSRLLDRYDGASKVITRNDGGGYIPENPSHKKPTNDDLVYIEDSPDFCRLNKTLGTLGTHGRECNKSSPDEFGCDIMCCHRGYDTKVIEVTTKCKCVFQWCCNVTCQQCVEQKEMFSCK